MPTLAQEPYGRCMQLFPLPHLFQQTYFLDLMGAYQLKNLPGVLQAVAILLSLNYKISLANIQDALKRVVEITGLKGRWQKIGEAPLTFCDTFRHTILFFYWPIRRSMKTLVVTNQSDSASCLPVSVIVSSPGISA